MSRHVSKANSLTEMIRKMFSGSVGSNPHTVSVKQLKQSVSLPQLHRNQCRKIIALSALAKKENKRTGMEGKDITKTATQRYEQN